MIALYYRLQRYLIAVALVLHVINHGYDTSWPFPSLKPRHALLIDYIP